MVRYLKQYEILLNLMKDNGIDLHTDNDLLIELNDYAVDLKKYG